MLPDDAFSHTPSTWADWDQRICQTMEMEELICVAHYDPSKFTCTWACCLDFQELLSTPDPASGAGQPP